MTLWTYIIFKIWGYPYMETRCRVNVVYIIISSVYNIKKISIIFQIFCIFPPHLIFIPCWRWIPLVFFIIIVFNHKNGPKLDFKNFITSHQQFDCNLFAIFTQVGTTFSSEWATQKFFCLLFFLEITAKLNRTNTKREL